MRPEKTLAEQVEPRRPVDEPEAVVDLMVGQLFLGFITQIFWPDVAVAELERRGADTLRAAIFGDVPSP